MIDLKEVTRNPVELVDGGIQENRKINKIGKNTPNRAHSLNCKHTLCQDILTCFQKQHWSTNARTRVP